ncbi:toxic anion resistance protein [Ileibacterium valens]|uniref:Toxic anion resistance protein n=1 Tax=Ileibacterium valens TaxID=1862668 RepID=A0A1U7ND60_9FIRM|nr:toxic anion resistance protein [Ileibacterium valens]OLU36386.1 toxic anion resistance protein [Erysipelotrichaceae bacterium NYU-BL-E8]OLU36812.1 toxic anion resistance protein [Ileibacterium valens]OLU42592.1 toxic anion resistance protein [Erysipelotrichaceae bacterium NYU-BL-F16]
MAFTMDVEEMDKEQIVNELKPTVQQKTQLEAMADSNVKEIEKVDLDSLDERRNIANMIENFGKQDVERSADKNRMLEKTLGELSKTGSEGSKVVESLTSLNREMKELDPSGINFNDQGFFGKMFNPVRNYFQRYEKADAQINEIIASLEEGKKTLIADNTTLEIEQASLRNLTKKIGKQVELGMQMDARLEKAIEDAKVNNEDPEKIKYIQEECLFPLRQKVMDMQQMQAVNQQGYFAMEIVRRNNKELIRAVERAQNVTVSALRTAVTVASALYNQKIVLDKVKMINETTNNLIKSTSIMLKQQGADIQQQAMNANISVDTLKEAFKNTFEALDQVEVYKQKALPQMRQSIQEFRALADEGDARLERMDRINAYRDEVTMKDDLPKIPEF